MTTSKLLAHFNDISFAPGKLFSWSPRQQKVIYDAQKIKTPHGVLALLHEIGHARLKHQNYQFDIDLLNMEFAAWQEARQLANQLALEVDEEHIEDCLETYRIWLFKRSRCPNCQNTSVQQTPQQYRCFLCNSKWQVAPTRTTQPRRMRCVSFVQ